MRSGRAFLVVAAAAVIAACTSQSAARTTTTSVTTTTDAPTTTSTTQPATTTTDAPTTTTTILPWKQYPQNGVVPLPEGSIQSFSRIRTTDPVVFLTMDDGFRRDPAVAALLEEHHAPVTLFLISGSFAADPPYWQRFLDMGGTINSHTMRHAHLPGMSEEAQQEEICDMHAQIQQTFGSAGWFFRPPRGEYDDNTFTAARACGIRAMILWRVTVSDGVINTWGTAPIHPGDIILVHFVKSTVDSLNVLFAELDRLGLTVARLEDYLPAA